MICSAQAETWRLILMRGSSWLSRLLLPDAEKTVRVPFPMAQMA
jgi:hypothetical protein